MCGDNQFICLMVISVHILSQCLTGEVIMCLTCSVSFILSVNYCSYMNAARCFLESQDAYCRMCSVFVAAAICLWRFACWYQKYEKESGVVQHGKLSGPNAKMHPGAFVWQQMIQCNITKLVLPWCANTSRTIAGLF